MLTFLIICIASGLIGIIYQDFKFRHISLWLVIVIIIASIALSQSQTDTLTLINSLFYNILFLAIQLICIYAYFRIKYRTKEYFLNTAIGTGDLIFFIVPAVLFSTINFILVYTIILILTLLGFIAVKFVFKSIQTVPLAGAISLFLLPLIIFKELNPEFNFFNDQYLSLILNFDN
jgi:hypothetical protein